WETGSGRVLQLGGSVARVVCELVVQGVCVRSVGDGVGTLRARAAAGRQRGARGVRASSAGCVCAQCGRRGRDARVLQLGGSVARVVCELVVQVWETGSGRVLQLGGSVARVVCELVVQGVCVRSVGDGVGTRAAAGRQRGARGVRASSAGLWETGSGRVLQLGGSVARVVCELVVQGVCVRSVGDGVGTLRARTAAGRQRGARGVRASSAGCRAVERTDDLLAEAPPDHDGSAECRAATWERVEPAQWARGVRGSVLHAREVAHVCWHARGDYVCCTLRPGAAGGAGGARAVLVHQLSRRRSQLPLARCKGLVQCALFHPTRPQLLVATQRVVRVYDLLKQELVRKLLTGAQWISNMAVHPAGDNLLVCSYDRKCIWFDLELSSKPYQTLRLHGGAVRSVAFHRRYPLFASGGDDDNIVVSHGMVYNDLLQNPLLVPLKQLRGGARAADLLVLDLRWHPTQPWLLAACADGTLRLYA
ncbi:hypothetical protein HW555_013776, partial [Spodoptera exigua]